MTTQTESIHGHEVMHLLLEKGPLTRSVLAAEVATKYGADALFHTCSASEMKLEQLLEFLLSRSKISEGPAGLAMKGAEHICDHG